MERLRQVSPKESLHVLSMSGSWRYVPDTEIHDSLPKFGVATAIRTAGFLYSEDPKFTGS